MAGCSVKLKRVAELLGRSRTVRKDRLAGPIAAMRVRGSRGFALFRGTDGRDWGMPLEREGATWKVAAIQEEELLSKASKLGSPSN